MARQSRSRLRFQFTAIGPRALKSPLFSGELEAELIAFMRVHMQGVLAEVQVYPAPNPNSKYERTFTDFSSWEIKSFRSGSDLSFRAENNATDPRGRLYSRYLHGPGVQSSGYQNRARRGQGWRNIDDYIDRPGFNTGIQAIFLRAIAATRGV